jgi:hypothetical protein
VPEGERHGTWWRMNFRDWLILTSIVGGLVLMFAVTRYSLPERVKPGSPEYAAYIEHYVAECLRAPPPVDKTQISFEARSDAQRESACRVFVQQADRLNPVARPLKQPGSGRL